MLSVEGIRETIEALPFDRFRERILGAQIDQDCAASKLDFLYA